MEFTNETVTSCGTFAFIEAFKTTIQLKEMIQEHIITERAPNALYPYDVLIDQLLDALLLGPLRYCHTNLLRNDPGYRKIKDMDRISEETTKRKAFLKFSEEQIKEFKKLNQKLVSLLLSFLPCQSVWVNGDDTVIALFSIQEKGAKGYNPKYPGHNSYKAKVMALGELDFVINMGLYSGDTASNGCFYEHLKESLDMLKNLIGGFSCHFWSKHIEKLYKKGTKRKEMLEKRDDILEDESIKEAIASTINAIESFVNIASIALGILQIISLKFYEIIWEIDPGYKRTKSSRIPSEKDAQNIVRMLYYNMPRELGTSILFKIIKDKQRKDVFDRIKNLFKIA